MNPIALIRIIAPFVSEAIELAEEIFPNTAGSDKLNFVLNMLESNFPESVAQHATFETMKPFIVAFVTGAIAIFRKYKTAFKKPDAPVVATK